MFPIYLYEDNREQRESYQKTINNTVMINEYAMELIIATTNQQEILADMSQRRDGLFFLDMEIGENEQAGLELASEIRQQLPLAKIVFITTHDELSFVTLERRIAPLDYILKDQSAEQITQKIAKDIKLTQQMLEKTSDQLPEVFSYKIGTRLFTLALADVIMLSTHKDRPGNVTLSTANRLAEFPGNLSAIADKHPSLFRCDKSALVNLSHVQSFDSQKRELLLDGGIKCDVSFRRTRELNKILKNADGDCLK